MAHLHRALIFFCFLLPFQAIAQTAPGTVDLAGWIKNADGTYTKAFDNARVTLTSAPKGITTTSTALVPTSKGVFDFEITKTANVDTARLGGKVASFAKKVGPLGMALTAASLICDLSDICNIDGKWQVQGSDPYPSLPNSYPVTNGKWTGWETNGVMTYYPTPSSACSDPERLRINVGSGATFSHLVQVNASTYQCYATLNGATYYASNTSKFSGCASQYTQNGTDCTKTGLTQTHEATQNDWDAKQNLLNDDRFTPHLIEAGEDLPTGIPTLTPGQKKDLGLDSVPVRDSSGNVIGRDDTMTSIEPVDAATSDNPGRVIIKETRTTVRYDNNNTQISTSTSTSYSSQTVETKPQSFEIKFDEVPPAELQTHAVPNTFSSTSWGGGTCPPNIDVALSNFSFTIPTQPVCDTAVMINPFVLLLASLIGVYIISGVRSGNAT